MQPRISTIRLLISSGGYSRFQNAGVQLRDAGLVVVMPPLSNRYGRITGEDVSEPTGEF